MKVTIPSEIGDQNKYAILKLIKGRDGISRNDIARNLRLSPTAVSKNVNALIAAGIIREEGTDNASIGRKPIILRYNNELMCVLGVEVMPQELRGAISDLNGSVLGWQHAPSKVEQGAQAVLSQLDLIIDKLFGMCPLKSRVATIAMAIPALSRQTDENNLMSIFIPEWNEINAKEHVENRFGVPVVVMNDVELDLIGECSMGAGVNYKDILYIKYGEGFAARTIINGKLLSGCNGAAGELGYYLPGISSSRDRFSCPGVTEQQLCRDIFHKYKKLSGGDNEAIAQLKFRDLIVRADSGDNAAITIVDQVVDNIAVIISNMVLMLDPEIVILGAEASYFREKDIARIRQVISSTCPFVPKIATSKLGSNSAIFGGIQIALKHAEDKLASYWK